MPEEVTGKMPEEVTGKMPVPHAEEKERASFYLFMSQLCNAVKSSINSLLTDCSYNILKKLDLKPNWF